MKINVPSKYHTVSSPTASDTIRIIEINPIARKLIVSVGDDDNPASGEDLQYVLDQTWGVRAHFTGISAWAHHVSVPKNTIFSYTHWTDMDNVASFTPYCKGPKTPLLWYCIGTNDKPASEADIEEVDKLAMGVRLGLHAVFTGHRIQVYSYL